ncbi:MAG: DUF302 domain-containing protein [Bacteriovorax sp.]|nr:DUF302 domain-containing protein [Bacteriovorax sp.]
MNNINFKKKISGNIDQAVEKITEALKKEGFGILTRIDLHKKIKEKLGKDMPPVIILGACNPELAFESYNANSDVASLLPCNAVLREISPDQISIELAKPSFLMEMINDPKLIELAEDADKKILRALESL